MFRRLQQSTETQDSAADIMDRHHQQQSPRYQQQPHHHHHHHHLHQRQHHNNNDNDDDDDKEDDDDDRLSGLGGCGDDYDSDGESYASRALRRFTARAAAGGAHYDDARLGDSEWQSHAIGRPDAQHLLHPAPTTTSTTNAHDDLSFSGKYPFSCIVACLFRKQVSKNICVAHYKQRAGVSTKQIRL